MGVGVGVGVTVGVGVGVGVGIAPFAVRQKSSMPRPSSAPVGLKSIHRIQKLAPLGMLRPLIVLVMSVRLAAAFPSNAPTVPVSTGATKFNAVTAVHVPVVKLVASVLN